MDKAGILTSWSIRKKILFLSLFILIPAFAIIVAAGLNERQDRIEKARNDALLLAQSLAAQQEQMAIGTKQMLSTLAQMPELQSLDAQACSELFQRLHRLHPFYSVIAATTPDGMMFAGSTPFEPGISLADRKHFKDAKSSLDFAVGEHIVGRVSNVQSLNYAFPVLDANRRLIAVVIAGFRLNEYARFLSKAHLPDGYVVVIVDCKGVRLYRFPENDIAATGTPIPNEAFELAAGDAERGILERTGEDGVQRIYAYQQLRLTEDAAPYLYVFAGIPEDKIFQTANFGMLKNILILSAAALLAIGLAWVFANSFLLTPINQLVAATQRFGRGEMHTRMNVPHSADELGQLARSFDEMASLLEVRDKERLHAQEELNQAYAAMEERVIVRTAELSAANAALLAENAERRRAEEALRQSQAQIRDIAANIPGVIFQFVAQTDGSMKLSYVSGRASEITGIDHQAEDAFDQFYAQIVEDDRQNFIDSVKEAVATVSPWEFEGRFINPSGEISWFSAMSIPEHHGEELLFNGVMLDITARKVAEARLRDSEERYRKIFEDATEGIYQTTPEGRYLSVNPAFARMFGFSSPEEMIHEVADIRKELYVDPQDRDLMVRMLNEHDKVEQFEVEVFRKDRSKFWISINIHTVRDAGGRVRYFEGTNVDINERKLAEQSLRESEKKFRTIFEMAPYPISITDIEGRYLDVNASLCEMAGLPRKQILGHRQEEIPGMYLPANPEYAKELDRKFHAQGHLLNEEIDLLHPVTNKHRTLIFSSRMITLSGSACVVMMSVDVTERKQLEDQLLHAQKMQAIGQLAGGVAHDFNNLLQAILGYSEMLLRTFAVDDPRRKHLLQVQKAAERAASLTTQLLAFSRRQVLRLAPLDLNLVIEELMQMVKRLIGENIELIVLPGAQPATVNADRSQIEQILLNLCVNARDAMPEGGHLTIETENAPVDAQYCTAHEGIQPGEYVVLTVTDSGCGMDQQTMQQIFNPFFTTKETGRGTGLGLATVYGIVRQHEGMVEVESEPGKGSRFRVFLPSIAAYEPVTISTYTEPAPGGGETILLAEDDEPIRLLSEIILKEAGYRVLAAADGEEALRLYGEHRGEVDLLLFDVVMPKMGGRKAFDEIRAIDPGIKCIFVSGYSDEALQTDFIFESKLRLIRKPCGHHDLLRTVRQVLDE